jgi:hypothetical protein
MVVNTHVPRIVVRLKLFIRERNDVEEFNPLTLGSGVRKVHTLVFKFQFTLKKLSYVSLTAEDPV